MTNDPVDLDTRRSADERRTMEARRRIIEMNADNAALRRRQDDLEYLLTQSWPEATRKAEYLIKLFANTPQAQDPEIRQLVASTLKELRELRRKVQKR